MTKCCRRSAISKLTNKKATNRQLGLVEDTHVFSLSFVNTARGGVSRNVANITNTSPGLNPLAADKTLGGVPGRAASSMVIGDSPISAVA